MEKVREALLKSLLNDKNESVQYVALASLVKVGVEEESKHNLQKSIEPWLIKISNDKYHYGQTGKDILNYFSK
jgi:hypothetical protein